MKIRLHAAPAAWLALCAALPGTLAAEADLSPEIFYSASGDGYAITRLSNNGKWGICSMSEELDDGSRKGIGGLLTNLDDMTSEMVTSPTPARTSDVTDDGNIIVGSKDNSPAYYNRTTGEWVKLPLPAGFEIGHLLAVTPDGKYACGFLTRSAANPYQYDPAYYDLVNGEYVATPGFPKLDMNHDNRNFNLFTDLSADGRYLLGCMSQDILEPRSMCSLVYDTQDDSYVMLGFIENDTQPWTPLVDDLYFIKNAYMSPQGNYVTGYAWLYREGQQDRTYQVSFIYDVATKEFNIFDGDGDAGVQAISVTDDGVVLAKTPADNPYAACMVRSGKFFYSLDQIFRQVYGIDFEGKTGLATTGMPITVSGDGNTMVMQSYDECYVIKLKESLAEAAKRVNLLAEYTVDPPVATAFTTLTSLTVTFERNIVTTGEPADVKLLGPDGVEIRGAAKAEASGTVLNVSFRSTQMEAGKQYTISIPEGFLAVASAPEITSHAIDITYEGRDNVPVAMVSAAPADGTAVAKLDSDTSPLLLTFDAYLKLNSTSTVGQAYLYRDEETEPYCTLYVACADKRLLLYPASTQYLFKGSNYRVVLPAATVTDLSGKGANEEIVLSFEGSYERTISQDDVYLFNENCNSFLNFMFYEGDKLTPQSVPMGWGFTAETTPWYVVRDSEESVDMAFASHSMYSPAGQSDDWCVIPQLFMPDERCYLQFDSQSYLSSKQDRLKVYVLACDDVYNVLKADFVERIRTEGELVYDEQQTPGADEELLAGDWRNNVVTLEKYAGKNVYIAFVNDNYDQSAVFIDNIQVVHDMKFLTSVESATRVIAKEDIQIKGSLIVASDLDTFNDLVMVLRDAAGTEIDRIEETNLGLQKNGNYRFTFANPLPLTVGTETRYTIDITFDDEVSTFSGSIKDLTFEPQKYVVLEEFTGVTCPNCPLGILAVENIEHTWGDKFIPIAIHTYSGDPYGSGLSSYSTFLGMNAAPTGRVNRGPVAAPMYTASAPYSFSGRGKFDSNGLEYLTWLDLVNDEMAEPAEAQVDVDAAYVDGNINITTSVTYALNVANRNYNLFAVLLENGIVAWQDNNLYASTDEIFGEWGSGGIYGKNTVIPYTHDHVVRACIGSTFNGTGGLLPTDFEAGTAYDATITCPVPTSVADVNNCQVVVIMIDANTDMVVNAAIASVGDGSSAIDSINGDGTDVAIVALPDGTLSVSAAGELTVEVYALSGMIVDRANGCNQLSVNCPQGVAIVKVTTADGVVVKKVTIK